MTTQVSEQSETPDLVKLEIPEGFTFCKQLLYNYLIKQHNKIFSKYETINLGANMTDYIQVMTTVENKSDAEKIAKHLVEEKIAACVQILGPLQSFFQWQGKLDRADEYLCLIKSRDDLFDEIEAAIKSLHPYEVPEIIALPISKGSSEYLSWMAAELEA
jgi:periplasmic divalent cation tolerance protein